MIEDTRVCGANVGLEAGVEHTDLTPVKVESLNILISDTSAETGLLKSRANGSHWWLRGETGHTCAIKFKMRFKTFGGTWIEE